MWNMLLCEEGWNTATLPAFWKIYPSAYAASCTQRLVMRITTELDPKGEKKPEWEPGFEQAGMKWQKIAMDVFGDAIRVRQDAPRPKIVLKMLNVARQHVRLQVDGDPVRGRDFRIRDGKEEGTSIFEYQDGTGERHSLPMPRAELKARIDRARQAKGLGTLSKRTDSQDQKEGRDEDTNTSATMDES